MTWQSYFGWRGKVDAKYFDDVVEVMKDLMDRQLADMGKGPDDNISVCVSSLNLRSLLDYCAILRPLLDAVELGEVEQYKKGLEDGRRQGRDSALEDAACALESVRYQGMGDAEVADYLRSLKSGREGGVR